jgi:2-hydroxy-6-oxonona-2,4-dienedioate hydrolase
MEGNRPMPCKLSATDQRQAALLRAMTFRSVILMALLLTMFAAGGWVFFAYQRDISASRERLVGKSQVIETASGPIEYAEAGEGPVILVVHGAGGGFDQGLEILGPLAARGFRLVAISRFGYLRTPLPPDASPTAQAEAHASLMDALGIERAAIFGVSAGASSAMQFAIKHPERCAALVLMVPIAHHPANAAGPAPRLSPLTERLLLTIVGSDFAYWAGSRIAPGTVTKTVMGTPPEIMEKVSAQEQFRINTFMEHILPISGRVQGIMKDAEISNSIARFDLGSIEAPTLLLGARDDLYGTFAGAEYTATQIPHAQFIAFETGGHMLAGHWDQAMTEIDAFLKSNGPFNNPKK